jgi:peptide/nickel transport system ATP-binding protein
MSALLTISGLSVGLPAGADRTTAIEDVAISVGAGETVCVVGESGSGKSVTAQAVMGLLPKTLPLRGGSILFGERDLARLDPEARRRIAGREIAMIFQEPMAALNPVFRVGKLVAEPFRVHTSLSEKQIAAKVVDLFRAVRLPDPETIGNAYPHQLSGGQCQRVMIAIALALEPKVLIADEPTTALDVTTQAQILSLMRDLRRERGTGILFITHDFGVVADVADRVVVMRHGRVVETGTAAEVLGNPREAYTRALVEAVPKLEPRAERPGNRPPMLEARAMTKTYAARGGFFGASKPVAALDRATITIGAGETLGVVGESGSGKSTLASCVMRLVEPDGGEITIDGRDFRRVSGAALRRERRLVQIVFQDPYGSLDPRQKIGEAVAEGPIIHGTPRDVAHARARQLLAGVGLSPEAAERFPHEFSGGQRQRVCIARALALEPKLLVCDEAVSALDVSVQAQVLDLLERLQAERGFAMLFITHDLRVAARICDRIAVMRGGRVVEEGAPRDILFAPREDYTKALIAAVPGRERAALEPA